jgi:hypothetical protein
MADINKFVKELWQRTYRNQDIDYIQVHTAGWDEPSDIQSRQNVGSGDSHIAQHSTCISARSCSVCANAERAALQKSLHRDALHNIVTHRARAQERSRPWMTAHTVGRTQSIRGSSAVTALVDCEQLPQIKADSEGAGARSYNYRVVMYSGGAELDMRGRCSAGQRARPTLAHPYCRRLPPLPLGCLGQQEQILHLTGALLQARCWVISTCLGSRAWTTSTISLPWQACSLRRPVGVCTAQ